MRLEAARQFLVRCYFNPRIPVRNATLVERLRTPIRTQFQSTHSCAECDVAKWVYKGTIKISIHAFLCGMRHSRRICKPKHIGFQSTHSCAECDPAQHANTSTTLISIHAFLCGMRPRTAAMQGRARLFQSTHSCAECDQHEPLSELLRGIFQSTHSCAECDLVYGLYI